MKHLELPPRLQAVAELVPHGAALADVGTDHAYLPVWLLMQGRVCRAIASDLRSGPLDRARLTAQQYACGENLDFRLCNGLEKIGSGEVDAIVIAGMGGENIASILNSAQWTRDEKYTLILQPMSAQPDLRSWLWKNGFSIKREEIVREGKKLYNVIVSSFLPGYTMTKEEELAGKQSPELVQPHRSEYLTRLMEKTERAMAGISRGTDETARERLIELEQLRDGLARMKEEWDAWQR